jgi:hypothetical protein
MISPTSWSYLKAWDESKDARWVTTCTFHIMPREQCVDFEVRMSRNCRNMLAMICGFSSGVDTRETRRKGRIAGSKDIVNLIPYCGLELERIMKRHA